ncbi:MAG: flagellar hook-basal body complex protein FliE [Candidatus Paceibacteria bacterium]|jgi:flagellar hook-basal body complex protein FliE
MVNGVGSGGGSIARDAIKAAMQRQSDALQRLDQASERLSGSSSDSVQKQNFSTNLTESFKQVNQEVQLGENLVEGIVTGEVTDFHEIAAQVKRADLSFKFALAVRNKFIDAYREVMRMSV